MQKTIIAAAIIGLVSVGASAVTVYDKDGTKFSVGGKFDFAFQYSDVAGKETRQVTDGKYSTSRVTFSAEEALSSDLTAYFGYDVRMDNIFAGKASNNSTTSVVVSNAGLSSNDAMKGGLVSKKFGRFEAGTINVAAQQFVFKKNYVNKAESEIVKYGISSMGLEALSNRNIYVHSTDSLPVVVKASYAFSDAAAADSAGKKTGLYSIGVEGKYSIVNVGAANTVKSNTNIVGPSNRLEHLEGFVAAEQGGKKISFFASHDKDLGAAKAGSGFGLNAYYLVGDKIDLGVAFQRYVDTSGSGVKNSGKGYMAGAHYYAGKNTAFFVGTRFDNWEGKANTDKVGKIVGNAAGFTGSATKADGRAYFTGFNLSF